MTHPSYLLNPGDMFQVDVDRVMMATGKPKKPNSGAKAAPETSEAEEPEVDAEEDAEVSKAAEEPLDPAAAKEKHMAMLKEIKEKTRRVLETKKGLRAKHKQELRALLAQIKAATLASRNPRDKRPVEEMDRVEKDLTALMTDLTLSPAERAERRLERAQRVAKLQAAHERNVAAGTTRRQRKEAKAKARDENRKSKSSEPTAADTADITDPSSSRSSSSPASETPREPREPARESTHFLSRSQRLALRKLVEEEAQNPHDPSKPYQTPWQPRDYMSPFAFIPRYLEVNPRICAAVYLRHPVARPGRSEVPTPFSPILSQLAFNWYLRRS